MAHSSSPVGLRMAAQWVADLKRNPARDIAPVTRYSTQLQRSPSVSRCESPAMGKQLSGTGSATSLNLGQIRLFVQQGLKGHGLLSQPGCFTWLLTQARITHVMSVATYHLLWHCWSLSLLHTCGRRTVHGLVVHHSMHTLHLQLLRWWTSHLLDQRPWKSFWDKKTPFACSGAVAWSTTMLCSQVSCTLCGHTGGLGSALAPTRTASSTHMATIDLSPGGSKHRSSFDKHNRCRLGVRLHAESSHLQVEARVGALLYFRQHA